MGVSFNRFGNEPERIDATVDSERLAGNASLVATRRRTGLKGPVAAQLLEFNLLPSRTLHPAHAARLSPPQGIEHAQPRVQAALHRRWSSRLLQDLGAEGAPVTNLAEPALPLALLTPPLMQRLARDLGIVLLGANLRRLVEREEVLAARSSLGQEGMAWALEGAAKLHAGLPTPPLHLSNHNHNHNHEPSLQPLSPRTPGWASLADSLGAGLLAQAWYDAPPPLRHRADWKLPPAAQDARTRGAAGLTEPEARALCLQRLKQMESVWLSSFS